MLASPRLPGLTPHASPNTLPRHDFRLRLRIFRHTWWLSPHWPSKSCTKFRLFLFLQDLCRWSIHPPSIARLPPWANVFSALERETLQIVCTFNFFVVSGSNLNGYLKDLCVDDTEFRTTTTDPSMSPMLPLDSPRMIAEIYRIECGMWRHSTSRILSATDLVCDLYSGQSLQL